MSKTKIIIYSLIGFIVLLILILGISTIKSYNSLVEDDENINLNYAEIKNALKARHDKIVLISGAVIGLQDYALEVYDMLTAARAAYSAAVETGDMSSLIEADRLEALALTNLIAVVEDNPNLGVSNLYSQYISEVSSIESNLQYRRREYNLSITQYRLSIRKFPKNIFAKMFGFTDKYEYWELAEGEGDLPVVDFS